MGISKLVVKQWDADSVDSGIKSLKSLLVLFSESERRIIYGQIVNHILRNKESASFEFSKLKPPATIEIDSKKKKTYQILHNRIESLIANLGPSFVWAAYEKFVEGKKSEGLGQYFTPEKIIEVALNGLTRSPKTVLDPMAGHGAFLKVAKSIWPSASLTGVEIDPLPLDASRIVLDDSVRLIHDDVFLWALNEFKLKSDDGYDAVIGNPAYVSYQNIQQLSILAKHGIRSGHVDYKKFLLDSIRSIALARGLADEINPILENWSGYSDLAAYTILLAWLVTKSNGEIVFVTSNHWLEREYGIPLKNFLVSRGTIRGIITHRGGNWFPDVQIPTNIVVYSKGKKSDRQNRLGVPHVEILEDSRLENLNSLRFIGKNGFWNWIDHVKKPGTYGPLRVTFLDWTNNDSDLISTNKLLESRNLKSPRYLNNIFLKSLASVGWRAHQGLRTGCNEFFYVHRRMKGDKIIYEAKITKTIPKFLKQLEIPTKYVLPTIHKIPSNHNLRIGKNDTNLYLINLRDGFLNEDMDMVQSYPLEWQRMWKISNMEILPSDLSNYIRDVGKMPYVGNGTSGKPICQLSAVKTNCVIPKQKYQKITPQRPRFWYQVSLMERHFGQIIIPRVNGGFVKSYLIEEINQVVTDANFITFIPMETSLERHRLWIWLNSNTFRVLCEMNGIVMGGGALKVEAALVIKIPLPQSVETLSKTDVSRLTKKLKSAKSTEEMIEIGFQIDKLLLGKEIAEESKRNLLNMIVQRQKKC